MRTIVLFCACFCILSFANVADSNADFDLPLDVDSTEVILFLPIQSETVSDSVIDSVKVTVDLPKKIENDTVKKIEVYPIPLELSRPLKVGIIVGANELYIKYEGEIVKVTAVKNKVKLQAGENSMVDISREFLSPENGCIYVGRDKKSLEHSCYPGSIFLRAINGKVDAINSVDVEDYLRGVVPYEIGKLDSARIEALKAQAVAARTYAYKHFGSRESLGFDVFADTRDQVYKGLEASTAITDKAVKSTRGIVLTYNGEFIIAYYHSTCAGFTETPETWKHETLKYLKPVTDKKDAKTNWCDESSYSKWERKYSNDEIVKLFKANIFEAKAEFSTANAKKFKKVNSIKILNKLKSGRILTLRVTTDNGYFDVYADRTRWLFKKSETILPSSFFDIKKQNGNWLIMGKGFGHGVGMCQMGARARAQAGQSFEQILLHYYSGVTLQKFER